ncbi:lysylphosphatidylglycerol synthase transmembrane domain-containing protein [Tellurirhabdus bombi]|uniref:lysylphosphatidylglycerol synthase transmembrane domain-containing protein n=1 Tax=Tellurirhabdus bombi TaxID=2907205 RepID=UPI001F1D127E|nr:lysylphosphatidylglycerol synthase transmembrane domain-containing protein [Tellurirhabdus bombi]
MKTFLKRAGFMVLSGGLLAYVLRNIALADLKAQFQLASYGWLALVGAILLAIHIIRALRWQLVLRQMGYRPPLLHTTVAIMAGTFASALIPGAGEFTRCGTLTRTDGIPLSHSFGSVLAERIADLLVLLAAIALMLVLELPRFREYGLSRFTFTLAPVLYGLGALFLLSLFFYVLWVAWLYKYQAPLQKRISNFFGQFKTGFLSVSQLPNPGWYVLTTLLIYALFWAATYVAFFALPSMQTLAPSAAFSILTLSSISGLAVPTQGSIGTYHLVAQWVLMTYGLSEVAGAVTATFLHAVLLGLNLFWSAIGFFILPFLPKQR